MEIVNFESMNLDDVYTVPDFCAAGGGPDRGQPSHLLRRKGPEPVRGRCPVRGGCPCAGLLGQGGEPLQAVLERRGVDTGLLADCPLPQGHTVIQVSHTGENRILLFRGSNGAVTADYIRQVLDQLSGPAYIPTQNETAGLSDLLTPAAEVRSRLAEIR